MSVYVGIDVHRKRSQVAVVDEAGRVLANRKVVNGVETILSVIGQYATHTPVAFEAAFGWGWLVEMLDDYGFEPHLVHPSRCKAIASARLKNDKVDAHILAQLLRADLLPEAWIAPPAVRELRELVRYRAKLVALRSGLKAQVHAVMAKEGVVPVVIDMFGPSGNAQLDTMALADPYVVRVESLRDLIELHDREVAMLERRIHAELRHHSGYNAIQAINGIGRTIGAILVAEIGDVSRFRSPEALCSWAGLTPRHRESDVKTVRGRITKQGSTLVRWALTEAVARYRGGPKLAGDFHRIAERRGKNKARVAVARKVLTLVYYGLRDGEIRCLAQTEDAA